MNPHPLAPHHLGSLLVALQFVLIAVLAGSALPTFLAGQAGLGAWAAAGLGTALGLWALWSNQPGNFNVRPAPREGGQVIQHGPYRWIRHPMYTALIACGLACAWAAVSVWAWPSWVALVAVLVVKADIEERAMQAVHPAYAGYRSRTSRFLPGLL